MTIYKLSALTADSWPGEADREIRQARMLGRAAGEAVAVSAPSGPRAAEYSRLAELHGLSFIADADDAEPIAEAWAQRGLRVSLIVASYNYGHLLREAIDSAVTQSYRPDEIVISDDSSSDGSAETILQLAAIHPGDLIINVNPENMGIEMHFNKAVGLTSGDLVVILGADNRFPTHYVESCLEALLCAPDAALAYTDFALFGSRAKSVHDSLSEGFRGPRIDTGVYLSAFPEFDAASRALLFEGTNFIHGSSMYRRSAFDAVGGYGTRNDGPEDWDLFRRILDAGWGAVKAPSVYLEYRQHSSEQANMQFFYFWELGKLREDNAILHEQLQLITADRDRLKQSLSRLTGYPLYRFAERVRNPLRTLRQVRKRLRRKPSGA